MQPAPKRLSPTSSGSGATGVPCCKTHRHVEKLLDKLDNVSGCEAHWRPNCPSVGSPSLMVSRARLGERIGILQEGSSQPTLLFLFGRFNCWLWTSEQTRLTEDWEISVLLAEMRRPRELCRNASRANSPPTWPKVICSAHHPPVACKLSLSAATRKF